jgi:hypothetical protein
VDFPLKQARMKNPWRTARILSLGGCWSLAAAGQSLGQTWSPTGAPSNNWAAAACSADSSKVVAAAGGLSGTGLIYTSSDGGTNWRPAYAPSLHWVSVASSADGTRLVAAANGNGLYTSSDSGTNWVSNHVVAAVANWQSVAASADGVALAAVNFTSLLFHSTNSGSFWNTNNVGMADAVALAGSATGSRFVVGNNSGRISFSTSGGAVWSAPMQLGVYIPFLAGSADLGTVVAVVEPTFSSSPLLVTTNLGLSWATNNLLATNWTAVAVSADGTRCAAVDAKGFIYTCTDAGSSWNRNSTPVLHWQAVGGSADGSVIYAAASNGGIWAGRSTPAAVLRIAGGQNRFTLSWVVPSANFLLQQTASLSPAVWTSVTNAPVLNLSNVTYELTLTPSPDNKFYRLNAQ